MAKKIVATLMALCLSLLTSSAVVSAAPAQRYFIKSQPADDINLDVDHYKISLLRGWVSSKDSFFQSVLSNKTKLIVSIDEEVGFFDGQKTTVSSLYENMDIKKNTNQPWGQNVLILNNVPADADSKLNFQLAIHREDRISQIFQALESSKGDLGTDVLTAPWVGYSKAVGNIFNKLFETDKPSIPFNWAGNVKLGDVMPTPKMMLSHYIVLIAPNKSSDTFPQTLDGSKLTYDEASQQLKYDGALITDRSYLVLKVSKAAGYDIQALLLESAAPWAVLATAQFIVIPTDDVKTADQLSTLAKNQLTQLNNEIVLLKNEHRFSKFDRAVALRAFAVNSRDPVAKKCEELHLAAAQCPISGLNQFIDRISATFGLGEEHKGRLKEESNRLVTQMPQLLERLRNKR